MSEILRAKHCTPCRGGIPPLARADAERLRQSVADWTLSENADYIERRFRFPDFRKALEFVERVGELAETEGHHPEIHFGWGFCTVRLQTKKIHGLHENDFILAAKIDAL